METKSKPFLNSGEFIVLRFSCHLILKDIFQEIFVPSLLFVTNKRIFIESTIDSKQTYSIPYQEIVEMEQAKSFDRYSFVIRALIDVSVMVDFEYVQRFISIIKTLRESSIRSHSECDYYSNLLKGKFDKVGNIQRFFVSMEKSKYFINDNLVLEFPLSYGVIRNFDILREIIEADEFIIFSIIFLIATLLNLSFNFANFGILMCGSGFILLTANGFHMIFTKTPKIKSEPSFENKDEQNEIKYYFDNFQKRIFWKTPKKTLDVVFFLFTATLLFIFCDPLIVLGISLIAMSFVERWDPFGFGSFSEIISDFFSF